MVSPWLVKARFFLSSIKIKNGLNFALGSVHLRDIIYTYNKWDKKGGGHEKNTT